MSEITVAIPVGPRKEHAAYLDECLASVRAQTIPVEILLVDDMHGLDLYHLFSYDIGRGVVQIEDRDDRRFNGICLYRSPWRLGIPGAFNFGVALAPTEYVIMLGADDTLEPTAAERCLEAAGRDGKDAARTYYGLPVRYMDTGEEQCVPCNEAMVSKSLWRATGGFPPESAVGACDAAFLSSIWNSDRFRIRMVGDRPLCNYRRHAETDTATRSPAWQSPILEVRNLLTPLVPPQWGRYS